MMTEKKKLQMMIMLFITVNNKSLPLYVILKGKYLLNNHTFIQKIHARDQENKDCLKKGKER